MSLGDGVDDGEAETVAIAAAVTIGRQFLERLKEAVDLVVGDRRPVLAIVRAARDRVAATPLLWRAFAQRNAELAAQLLRD
ncbi:hypothetical protein AB0F43_06330 [Kribbella sp. NPDC023972]|uniref:hypothetical protein n=1 Tax=Kribbella sp. NPDC023972 TaxID=3154795 RepID=UPI0033F40CD0